MKGVIDFIYNNVKEGEEVVIGGLTLNNSKLTDYDFGQWSTPIMFVCHLSQLYRYFGKFLETLGYKQRKGNNEFYMRTDCLKNYEYCFLTSVHMVMKINDRLIQVFDANKWLNDTKDPWSKLTQEELDMFDELSMQEDLKPTPTQNAIPYNFFKEEVYFNEDLQREIEAGIQGGIIEGKPNFYKIAYHYDVTSLYPYIVSIIKKIPLTSTAKFIDKDEICDHKHYAYWIINQDDCLYHCNIAAQIAPAGSIKMFLGPMPSKYTNKINELYDKKSKNERNTPEYIIAKRSCNAFIGKMAQRKMHSYRRKMPAAYTYIIAHCRQHIINLMNQAKSEGARILQVNTDGFFTDLPISFYDKKRFLGSLRYEYKATNLYIYACNQYSCDQEVCIAGLPKDKFIPNRSIFEPYKLFTIIPKKNKCCYGYKKFTLGGDHYE